MPEADAESGRVALLTQIEQRLRWLSLWTVQDANNLRAKRDELKVAGHHAWCAGTASARWAPTFGLQVCSAAFSSKRTKSPLAVKPKTVDLRRMGKTNRLAANERKLALLIGEQRALNEKIAQAEKIIADLEWMKARIEEIDRLIEVGERWIKSDHPNWTGDHLRSKVPFVHDSPIRFGQATKLALAIVRESYFPMTIREIVIEACRREGSENVDSMTIDRLCTTVGNGLTAAKRRGVPLDHDRGYPARWFSTMESN